MCSSENAHCHLTVVNIYYKNVFFFMQLMTNEMKRNMKKKMSFHILCILNSTLSHFSNDQ